MWKSSLWTFHTVDQKFLCALTGSVNLINNFAEQSVAALPKNMFSPILSRTYCTFFQANNETNNKKNSQDTKTLGTKVGVL